MNRSDFTSLPLGIALGIVWDALSEDNPHTADFLASLPVPEKVRAPKYDHRIGRKGGFQWASETDLEGLRFWHTRSTEPGDPKYAEANAKRAKSLERWIAYREQDPASAWTGIRDDAQFTAHAPMAKPYVHEYAPRTDAPPKQYGAEYDSKDEDDELPFINNVSCEAGERWWR